MLWSLHDLWSGFGVALQGANLMGCFFGVLAGSLIGRLTGLSALSALSILLPLTSAMHPVPALLMLAGICCSAPCGGPAPGTPRVASFLAASVGILAIAFASPMLVSTAFALGPAETFSVVLLSLLAGATVSRGSPLKGMAMTLFGLLCRMVGTDPNSGILRFSFGLPELGDGIELAVMAMGLFALASFLLDVNRLQPGFVASRSPGLPGAAVPALILGALTIQGIAPGPQLVTNHPDIFWGLVASFWIGNALLLLLKMPQVPYRYLLPSALLFVAVGAFTTQNSLFQIGEVLVFGIVGALLIWLDFPVAPILLGFVLGPMMEENFLRAMLLSRGDPAIFVQRPISCAFVVLSVLLLVAVAWAKRRGRGEVQRKSATPPLPQRLVADAADR